MRKLLIMILMVGLMSSCQKGKHPRFSIFSPLMIINHKSAYSSNIQNRLDRIDFQEYEKLLCEYGIIIPPRYIDKFLKIQDSKIDGKSSAIGIGVAFYAKRYKLFFLEQGDGQRGQWVMVTYNYNNEQMDVKTFLYYCRSCRKSDLLTLYSLDPKKENEFVIHYYHPTKSKAEPCFENINVIKKEKWVIDSNGVMNSDKSLNNSID